MTTMATRPRVRGKGEMELYEMKCRLRTTTIEIVECFDWALCEWRTINCQTRRLLGKVECVFNRIDAENCAAIYSRLAFNPTKR